MTAQVHQIGTVFAVVDAEIGVQTDGVGMFPQDARSNPVKRPRPGQRLGGLGV